MTRVRNTVSWYFSGEAKKPGAKAQTIQGAKRTPRTLTAARTSDRRVKTARAAAKASSRPRLVRYSVNTGIKETVSAPSARSRRSRLGMRKATKKASAASPAPKK